MGNKHAKLHKKSKVAPIIEHPDQPVHEAVSGGRRDEGQPGPFKAKPETPTKVRPRMDVHVPLVDTLQYCHKKYAYEYDVTRPAAKNCMVST